MTICLLTDLSWLFLWSLGLWLCRYNNWLLFFILEILVRPKMILYVIAAGILTLICLMIHMRVRNGHLLLKCMVINHWLDIAISVDKLPANLWVFRIWRGVDIFRVFRLLGLGIWLFFIAFFIVIIIAAIFITIRDFYDILIISL